MRERLLFMGPPGSGKSEQMLNIASYIEDLGLPMHIIDLEDKMEAMILNRENPPKNINLFVALAWDEEESKVSQGGLKQITDKIGTVAKPGDWIGIDRIDLSWPMVQRWFTQEKYKESLAELMMGKSKAMSKSSMFIPRFDQGSWQVINEQYEEFILKLLYRYRCNVIMTTGIKGRDDNSPLDIGRLGYLPRGQKEMGHQPNGLFLLYQKKEGREVTWRITTDKDLKMRDYFENEELFDFSVQYLAFYYKQE